MRRIFLLSIISTIIVTSFSLPPSSVFADTFSGCPSGSNLVSYDSLYPSGTEDSMVATPASMTYVCYNPVTKAESGNYSLDQVKPYLDANNLGPASSYVDNQKKQALGNSSDCNYFSFFSHFQYCALRPTANVIGAFFLVIGVKILQLGGMLFDTALQYFVVSLGSTLTNFGIMNIITTVWTALRNVANIIIIGLFVFIAISIILGVKEYGDKKLIARVIVVSVLINFSLLFTKLVIDASDLTSAQIYTAILSTNQSISTSTDTNNQDANSLTSALLKPIGFTDIYKNSYEVIDETAGTTITTNTNNDGQRLVFRVVYGLVAGILTAAMGLVLLYACYVMFLRFFTLIIVLMTSSFAFASAIMPGWADQEYAWKGWKEALLNNAVFAPVFLFFIGITLLILQAANSSKTTGIGLDKIADPAQGTVSPAMSIYVLLTYSLAIGLLVFSVQLSRMFASKSGIHNRLSGLGNLALSAALGAATGGASTIAARGLQATLGANHYRAAKNHSSESEKIMGRLNSMQESDNPEAYRKLMDQKKELDKLAAARMEKAKNNYNFMDTASGKSLAKLIGRPELGQTSKDKGDGYAGSIKRAAKAADENAKTFNTSKDQKEAFTTQRENDHDKVAVALHDELAKAQQSLETVRSNIADKSGDRDQLEQNRKEFSDAQSEKTNGSKIKGLEDARQAAEQALKEASSGGDTGAIANARIRLQQASAAKTSAMQEQDARIRTAHEKLKTFNAEIDAKAGEHGEQDALMSANKTIESIHSTIATHATERANIKKDVETGASALKVSARKHSAEEQNKLLGLFRRSNTRLADITGEMKGIEKKSNEEKENEKIRNAFKKFTEEQKNP